MSKTKTKLVLFPPEKTIPAYLRRAKIDCPLFPLTLNEVKKFYWKFIKSKTNHDLEEAYEKRLAKHIKYVATKLKNNVNFKALEIGYYEIKENGILFVTDEHKPMLMRPRPGEPVSQEWLLQAIAKYETERCVNIIDNKIFTRLDISK